MNLGFWSDSIGVGVSSFFFTCEPPFENCIFNCFTVGELFSSREDSN